LVMYLGERHLSVNSMVNGIGIHSPRLHAESTD
jgi:hypothetical protein